MLIRSAFGHIGAAFGMIPNLYIYKKISSKFVPQKLKNGFAAGDARWRVHSVTPPDEHRLSPMSNCALC